MVVNSDPASDGRVRREAQALAEAGHRVAVFGVRWPGSVGDERGLAFEIVRPPLPRWVAGPGPLAFAHRAARWYGRFGPLVDAAMAWDPGALHSHDLDTVGPASAAALAAGIGCVYDDHEAGYTDKLPNYVPKDLAPVKRAVLGSVTRMLQRRGETLEREVRSRSPAAVVTVGDALAERIVARFGGPRPVVVRNLPVLREVPRTNALRDRLGATADDRILVYHGTATAGSGLETSVRALRPLGRRYLLAVVGRVWGRAGVEDAARAAGVADRVRFLPFVPEDEMFRLVASADVSVVPTEPNCVSHELSLPNKLFESMMVGNPVVASALPEVAPIVRRTGAGLTYEPGGPNAAAAMASAIARICEDRELRERCSEAGRRAVREEFNWGIESRRLLEIYKRLAGGPPTRSSAPPAARAATG